MYTAPAFDPVAVSLCAPAITISPLLLTARPSPKYPVTLDDCTIVAY